MSIFEFLTRSSSLIVGLVTVVVAILVYFGRGRVKLANFELAFPRDLDREAASVMKRITPPDGQADDQAELLLREYHAQGLAQSRISFWFSLVFASLGFAVIVISILTMERGVQMSEQSTTIISVLAGTIIDAVSGLFFVQSNKARQLMMEFFDKLRTDRKIKEALALTAGMANKTVQSNLQAVIAANFAGIEYTETLINSILNGSSRTQKKTLADKKTATAETKQLGSG